MPFIERGKHRLESEAPEDERDHGKTQGLGSDVGHIDAEAIDDLGDAAGGFFTTVSGGCGEEEQGREHGGKGTVPAEPEQ